MRRILVLATVMAPTGVALADEIPECRLEVVGDAADPQSFQVNILYGTMVIRTYKIEEERSPRDALEALKYAHSDLNQAKRRSICKSTSS